MNHYGKELILDLTECDVSKFNREDLTVFFRDLVELLDMEACDLHFWDDLDTPEDEKQTDPKTKGISAIQFIITSNITLHALDLLAEVYLNIFSCKDFDADEATKFCEEFFNANVSHSKTFPRG